MSEFVKKTIMGYKAVSGGQSDSECTHVILTKEEYTQLLDEISTQKRTIQSIKTQASQKIEEIRADAQNKVIMAQLDAKHKISEMQDKLTEAINEVNYQINLNKTLLRISKERANVDRKLKPKKEHTGYVVISSTEKEYKFKTNTSTRLKTAILWQTVIQSKYSIDFTEEQAKKQIQEELFNYEDNNSWLIGKIGITQIFNGKFEELLRNMDFRDNMQNYNVMFTPHFKANYRSGYWEIVFMHTKALNIIPKEMRFR